MKSLPQALSLVHAELKEGNLNESGVESAMRTLSYFAEISQLFRIALGTFDFGIVMLVLNNSSLVSSSEDVVAKSLQIQIHSPPLIVCVASN